MIDSKIIDGYSPAPEEIFALCKTAPLEKLCAMANRVREHFLGREVETCSIMNAKSGRCSENCKWCAQSVYYDTGCMVYDYISPEDALKHGEAAKAKGIRRFSLVTSGRTVSDKDFDKLEAAYIALSKTGGIALCGSFGLLNEEQFRRLAKASMTRYHCNLETAPSKFPELCTTHTIEEKIETINAARRAGLSICSGGIIGMGESLEQRIELAFALRALKVDSIPVNILAPIKNTPLENTAPLTPEDILQAYAIFRLVNPAVHIRFAGGRLLIKQFEETALKSGVSAILTGDFLTTAGASVDEDFAMLKRLGYNY